MNLNKDDFDLLRKQISSWAIKPTKILMHPNTWENILNWSLIDLYATILKLKLKVLSCKEIAPNEYEIIIDKEPDILPPTAHRRYVLKPRN